MWEVEGVKSPSGTWMTILTTYRIGLTGDTELVVGELREELEADDPLVVDALRDWGGPTYVASTGGRVEVALLRPSPTRPPRPWLIHGALLLLTLFTTFMAGALLRGIDPLSTEFIEIWGTWIPVPTTVNWAGMALGAPFAITLMSILMAHEMGHFLMAMRHKVPASLPYFIPFPAYYSAIGTLGAFIRMRGPIVRRSILLDIGVGGPIASFVMSLFLLLLGLGLSRAVGGPVDGTTPMVVAFAGQPIWLGSSLLVQGLLYLFFPGDLGVNAILLHPVAFAAWLGLFVTFLNLLPFGQLDGGHILYALSARAQRWAAPAFLLVLLPLGRLWWGWWLWAGLAVFLSRGRVTHPKVLQPQVGLGPARITIAWVAVLIFFLTFAPVPVRL